MNENITSNYEGHGKNGFGLIRLSNTRFIYPNFSGRRTDFNNEGDRNFGVAIDPELADRLREDGFRVKVLPPYNNDPDSTETNWIKVKVNMNSRIPPVVRLIKVDPDDPEDTEKMIQTGLNDKTIGMLDFIPRNTIYKIEMNIRPAPYPARPNRAGGISCYLDALYVMIIDDPLDRKYRNIRMSQDDPMLDDDLPFGE